MANYKFKGKKIPPKQTAELQKTTLKLSVGNRCASGRQLEPTTYACDSSASEGKESSDSEPAMSEVSDQYSMLEHAFTFGST